MPNNINDLKKILGIDPGYGRMGYAVVEKNGAGHSVLRSGCVETDKALPFGERLHTVGDAVARLVQEERPDAVAIEKLYFAKNQKTSLQVAEARGVIVYAAQTSGRPIMEFTPLEVKMAVCGYGRADKRQIAQMVAKLTRIDTKKQLDDTIDAIAIALTGFSHERLMRLNGAIK
ncbi:MAG: crossover junction endodeoxyribonuclease RuvC [Candidatus Niyogibacteria bacterium]|nr:crossover junction endodeoxyribonuclease RuvC [Candidatus Niyogibacteria bacterium]